MENKFNNKKSKTAETLGAVHTYIHTCSFISKKNNAIFAFINIILKGKLYSYECSLPFCI